MARTATRADEPKADPKLPSTKIFHDYKTSYIWCVTGTPCSTSLQGLATQARILGQWNSGLKLSRLVDRPMPNHDPPDLTDVRRGALSNDCLLYTSPSPRDS